MGWKKKQNFIAGSTIPIWARRAQTEAQIGTIKRKLHKHEKTKKKKSQEIYKILIYEDIPGQINQEKQSGCDEVDLIVVGMLGFFFSSIAAQMKKRTDAWDRESLIGARRLDSLFLFPLLRFPLFRFFIFFSQ